VGGSKFGADVGPCYMPISRHEQEISSRNNHLMDPCRKHTLIRADDRTGWFKATHPLAKTASDTGPTRAIPSLPVA